MHIVLYMVLKYHVSIFLDEVRRTGKVQGGTLALNPGPAPDVDNLATVSATMATLSRAVALAALIGAAAGQGAACNIADLFALLTEITTDAECRGGCNDGAGEASCGTDWYPGTADSCTANCGRVYEPFWDECGDMLTSAHMGGMEEMGVFYEHCVEELYPPGTCGTFCNQHTFDCFLAEVQEACCDEGGQNCVSGEDVPEECPIGCALVFPDFMEVCREHVSEQMPASLADFETFTQNCEDNDGEAIIEYLLDLKHKGCTIDLTDGGNNGRRQMQFLGQWIGSQQETCPWDTMDDLAREVDEICCGIDGSDCIASPANDNCDAAEDDCQDGLICDLIGPGEHDCLFPSFTEPPTCTPGCAIMLREFNHTCGETVQVLLGGGDVAHAIHAEVGAVAAGWTVDTVTEAMPSRAGAAGMVHGPFGSDVTDVEIDIHIPAGVERCEITWTSWSIDSRDGESDRLAVNDDVVWEKAAHASCAGWEHGPSEFVQQWGGDDDICMSVESVEVMCSGMLHLHFQSDIDQALADEGWAFSDVHGVDQTAPLN